jgi:hypothetical protein
MSKPENQTPAAEEIQNTAPVQEAKIKETPKPTFVLADDGSLCLSSEVSAVNAKIKVARDIAEAELKAIEEQAKKNK